MNGHIAFLILGLCLGVQAGLESIPPDLLPVWSKPIVTSLLTIVTFYGGYLKGLVSLPSGMVQVPAKTLDNLSTAAEVAATSPAPVGMDDRKPAPPITALLIATALLPAMLGACAQQPVSTPEAFSRSCSTVGEAMVQVDTLRRQGKVDDATFVAIDNAYDAAVQACDTLPVGDTATAVATEKVAAFLAAAGNVTGTTYQY